MKESFMNLEGIKSLSNQEQKNIFGGTDRVWTLTCKDGTQFCLNPNGVSQQTMVNMCSNYGGYLKQSMEPVANSVGLMPNP
ncbi:hypothetical protein H1R17_09835 [Flavobacterium sp. xlx-214]|uniref:hypothetical protein n=1 Tax=unclassified Flavobacterium TaxID=196869 RepID=UPI0013D67766|nr:MULTISPECIES: hypothetical protein [unclassified Flavobacterium]MBA5793461.1 hypothetical protein [Flavobacterium sp. xlx-221]QMI82767.1 hypothetical protein H1R17_09835 [Flavobacterium sp. xlx-214]